MDLLLKPPGQYAENAFELNCELYNLMESAAYLNEDFVSIQNLNKATSTVLQQNYELKYKLLKSPILCGVPILTSVREWDSLFAGNDIHLANSFSLAPTSISPQMSAEIKFINKNYINYLISASRTSPLAILELGIPFEVVSLLRGVTVEQKNNALRFKLPLFKWRYNNLGLNNTTGAKFGEMEWVTHLIHSTPMNLLSLNATSELGKRYHSEEFYPLAEHLVRYNMRATIITVFIPNLHKQKIREMYQRIVKLSSSCGKLPKSNGWFFATERRRAHSSLYILLYRLAMKSGLQHIQSMIASYSWYMMLCPEDPIAIDRLGLLINNVQSGSGTVYVASCRSCTSNYLLSNSEEKPEFAHSFRCEKCRKN